MWETRDMFDDEPIDPVAAFWTAERRALLGTAPDAEIAVRLGVTKGLVVKGRELFGIEQFDPEQFWTAERRALLGTAPDREIAELLGTTILVVFLARLKFNVKPSKRDVIF